FFLTLYIVADGEDISISIEYYTGIFRLQTIQRMGVHFKNIISDIIRRPAQKLKDIEIISPEEKRQVLRLFNDTEAEFPQDKTLHQLFREQVEKTPDHIALEHEHRHLTYDELNRKSHQLALYLLSKGVRPGSIIGISMPRSIELIIGVIAILKAGGAFLNLDPDYPEERIDFMLRDSGTKIIVANGLMVNRLDGLMVINPYDANEFPNRQTNKPINQQTNLAYIIYTSGSTGTPKGVIGLHKGMVNRFNWMWNTYPFQPKEVCCQKTSMNFVDCIWEIFGPLLKGLPLVIVPPEVVLDFPRFVHILRTRQVTRIVLVPSLLYRFFDGDTRYYEELPDLVFWVSSGEALRPEFPEVFKESKAGSLLLNLYGSSEVSADVTHYNTSENTAPGKEGGPLKTPIGKPIHNTRVYILDETQSPLPIGITGEIYIGGAGLAAGYLNQPELTAEKFLYFYNDSSASSVSPETSAVIFKTGDLARWLADGVIEYFGRKDQQVKVRGFRVEPGEIESQLLRHEQIKEAVVISRKDHSGEDYLCAYYVPVKGDYIPVQGDAVPTAGEGALGWHLGASVLKEYLSDTLPDYMVPSFFVQLDKMPLTPSGKVHRKALPEPSIKAEGNYIAPRNPIEEQMAKIWAHILKLEKGDIGIDDNFFLLGGHSLKATLLVAQVHKSLGIKVPLPVVFKNQTIRKLSAYIKSNSPQTVDYAAIPSVEKREYYPASSAQNRLYFLNRLDQTGTGYNIMLALPIGNKIDKNKLGQVLKQLISRHESLRTSFHMVNEELVQRIHDAVDFEIRYQRETPGIFDRFIRPFDLGQAPLIRSSLISHDQGHHTWLMDIHHIISDGTSQRILEEEFIALYNEEELKPPTLNIQYKDFSQWQ
ncbi:MAG: amino acid adenylation domain-containing protein, partial [bacterium]|nr:amino acid adenylation domain-containing protein [bacterium]